MKERVTAKNRGRRPEMAVRSQSPAQTELLGRELAGSLCVPAIVLLSGSLGSGKTTLARGLAAGLGIVDPALVHSPSFTIVNVYHGKCPIYHVDLYRLGGKRDLSSIGLEDFLGREGVTIVEWGERLPYVGEVDLAIELQDAGDEARVLRIRRRRERVGNRNRTSTCRRPRPQSGNMREPRRS
jgi:tRNA threonylcarbamoyladenosine biosynthesis protein TsaE